MPGRDQLKMMVLSALFAALMIVGAYIKIPLGPVPVVLANMFVIFAGILLGPLWGMAGVGTYLFLGLIGLPVFSGGGGPGYFAGPTGGYLAGYLLGAAAAGLISGIGRRRVLWSGIGTAAGFLCIYGTGVPWLKHTMDLPWSGAAAAGLLPFLPGDGIKAVVIIALYAALYKKLPDLIPKRSC